ncbi:HEAT repeat domain-containing protein [Novipirellula sp. SH528]|uniref:HEAT repeat domain-containing protein n=1 Tax=Novipirellula sp. SH528 TaxID=3454466 RepID=UPI003FA0D097
MLRKSAHTYIVILVVAACLLLAPDDDPVFAQDAAAVTAALEFTELPVHHLTNFMEMSADGTFLVLAHQADNKVSIYDVLQHQVVATIDTPSPRVALWRNDHVIVGSRTDGSVKVYSKANDWKLKTDAVVPKHGLVHISAAYEQRFKGNLLVTTHGDGMNGHRSESMVFAVNAAGLFRPVAQKSLATISFDGSMVFEQEPFPQSPSGSITGFRMRDYLTMGSKAPKMITGGESQTSYAYQVARGGYLIGRDTIYSGVPLTKASKDLGDLIIADRSQPIVYGLSREQLTAHQLNPTLSDLGRKVVRYPERYRTNVTSSDRVDLFFMATHQRKYILDHPEAYTHGDRTYLFVRPKDGGHVLTLEFDTFGEADRAAMAAAEKKKAADAPIDNGPRDWTSRDQKFSVNAIAVSHDARSVTLKRTDNGKVVVIPLAALSQADRDFVKELNSKTVEAPAKPAEQPGVERVWTTLDGRSRVKARLIQVINGRIVELERIDNGKSTLVLLSLLSKRDQEFIAEQANAKTPGDAPMVASTTPPAAEPSTIAPSSTLDGAIRPFSGTDTPDVDVPDEVAKLASGETTNEAELVKYCLTFPNAEVRSELIDRIGMDDQSTVDEMKLVSILRAGMLDPSVQVRVSATYALENLVDVDDERRAEALPELLQNLGSNDADLSEASIDVIHNLGRAAAPAVSRLIEALEQADFPAHDMVCLTLANIGDPAREAIPALKRFAFLDQSDEDVVAAFKMLGKLGAEDAIAEGLATKAYLTLHGAAIGAGWLPKHSPNTVVLLKQASQSEFASVRSAAVGALGTITPSTEAISKLLVESLKDEEEIVRHAAADALAQVRPKFPFARDALLAGTKSDDETLSFKCEDALDHYDSVDVEEVPFDAIVEKTLAEGEFNTATGAFINQTDSLLNVLQDTNADTMRRAIAFMALNRLMLNRELDPDQKMIVIDNALSWTGKANPIDLRLALVTEYPNESPPFKPEDDEHGLYVAGINGGGLRSMREHCLRKCGELELIAAVPEIVKLLESDDAKDSVVTLHAMAAIAKMQDAAAPAYAVLTRDMQKFSSDLQPYIAKELKSPGSTKPPSNPGPEMNAGPEIVTGPEIESGPQRFDGPIRVVEGDEMKQPPAGPSVDVRNLPADPEQVPSNDVNVRPVTRDVVALTPYCQIGNFEDLDWRLAYREPTTFIAEKADYTESIVVVIEPRVESQEEKRALIKKTFEDQIEQWELRDYKIVRATQLDPIQTIRAGVQFVFSAKHTDDDQLRENITRIKFDDPNYIYIFKASAKSSERVQSLIGITDTFRKMTAD